MKLVKIENEYGMNWYDKFIKLAFRNPLDMDAIAISGIILSTIKQARSANGLSYQTISFRPNNLQNQYRRWNSLSEGTVNIVDITIEVLRMDKSFEVSGNYQHGLRTLNIMLQVPNVANNFPDRLFRPLYMKLFEVVRHEIRHEYDNSQGRNTNLPSIERQIRLIDTARLVSERFLHEVESPAYIEGLLLRAKRERRPFTQLAAVVVSEFFYTYLGDYQHQPNRAITPEIRLRIQQIETSALQTLIQRARQRYPRLQ